tara:strand:+ start:1625 stop:1948 length:324 start_codon:yes stop_codon:yes gene_type:complete
MRIYLDDERNPKVEQFDKIVRSIEEFKSLVVDCDDHDIAITYISFDHDLGSSCPETTGYACAKHICEVDLHVGILSSNFTFNVHSANPVGAKNIQMYMDQYLNIKGE